MDYACVLLKTANVLFKFLGSPILKEIQSILKYEEDIEMLARTVELIKVVLTDFEDKHTQEQSVINAYNQLRAAFLDLDDYMDKVKTHKKQLEADDGKFKTIRRFFTRRNQPKYAIKMHNEMKEHRKNFDAIAKDIQKFGLSLSNITESTTQRPREACSFVDTVDIIGRDDDKRRIIDLLLGFPADCKKIPICSIVGISGMGKTTLAQLVFNDETRLGSGRFDLKLWVSDSEKFDMKLLMKKILLCISPDDTSLHHLGQEQLQNRLMKEIGGMKYLLILDDFQNESRKKWVDLEGLLNRGNKESRILVTTRSREVAKVTGSASTYELKGLSDHDAWQLFERMAFEENMDEGLVKIGKHIVKRCSQVPLAIKTIGCHLFGKNKRTWEQVRDIDFAKIKEESNDLMPILKISYDDLDATSKQCFQFCALFPKHVVISKEIMSNIWMANGCIKASIARSAEDACDNYLKILYDKCFLEEVERNEQGDVTHFKMHPLMHDLAKEVARAEMLVVDSGIMVDTSNELILQQHILHMNLKYTFDMVDQLSTFKPKNTRIRTLLHHDVCTWHNSQEKLVSAEKLMSQYQVLRVLGLQKWRIESLSDSIGKLIHLRFLDLSYNEFENLPDSIVELWNLQSLLLMHCTKLKQLPTNIVKLVNLRHLNLKGCYALTHLPSGMGALTSLQTLYYFIVGPPKSKYVARLEDLELLSKLQGELIIKLHSKSKLKEPGGGGAFLLSKRLRKLKIEWPDSRLGDDLETDVDILAKLEPHSDLEEFTLHGYEGLTFPPWAMRGDLHFVLPNLVSVIIDNCMRCVYLPSFSKLPRLRRLTICNLSSLEYIEEDVMPSALFFPSLEYLWLMELPKLKGWCRQLATGANNHEREPSLLLPPFPHLFDLHIYGCPCLKMTSMPLSSIQEFSVKGDDGDSISLKAKEDFSGQSKDSAACSSSSVNRSSKFHTKDARLLLSIPCEQYLKGYPNGKPVSLVIKDCVGFGTQSAIMIEAFRRMSNCLGSLTLHGIPRLKTLLKGMEHLTALRELCIESCHEFTFNEGEEKEQSTQHQANEIHSTSLKHPEIGECSSLELSSQEGDRWWKGLTCLESLALKDLPNLVSLPEWFQFVTSLKSLEIERCPSLKMTCQEGDRQWKGLERLESLALSHLPNLVRLPEWILSVNSLKSLEIKSCHSFEITSGELLGEGLTSLRCLSLIDLPKVVRLPEGIQFLNSLRYLHIHGCSSLEIIFQDLTSLESLTLRNLRQIVRLPQGIQCATSLQNCERLQFQEGIQFVTSLQNCERLQLQQGIQFVTSIQRNILHRKSERLRGHLNLVYPLLVVVMRLSKRFQLLERIRCLTYPQRHCERLRKRIQSVTSLQRRNILHCERLRLQERIQCVTSLQRIDILHCERLRLQETFNKTARRDDWVCLVRKEQRIDGSPLLSNLAGSRTSFSPYIDSIDELNYLRKENRLPSAIQLRAKQPVELMKEKLKIRSLMRLLEQYQLRLQMLALLSSSFWALRLQLIWKGFTLHWCSCGFVV